MKKSSFVVLLALSAITLVGCNSPSNIKGKFLDNEYILSLDDVKDFYDEFEVHGIDKEKIVLSSSNKNILYTTNGEDFKAISSGRAYVFAKYNNKTVAKVKVDVKYKLSSPQNFNLSTNGVLTWDHSSAVVDGVKYQAPQYDIEFSEIVDLNEINTQTQTIYTNSISFGKKGSYSVKIKAISDNELVDQAQEVTQIFHYGVMGCLEEVEFTPASDFSSQSATISWAEKLNAKYDVYVEGFKLSSNQTQSSFTFDYSIYNANENVQVEIVAKDINENLFTTSTKLNVKILQTPQLKYAFNKEGKVYWNNDVKATSYKLKISDYQGQATYKDITDKSNLEEVLAEFPQGIYDLQLTSIGGANGEYYVSSKPSQILRSAKLGAPQIDIEFVNNKANITFPDHDYVTDYKITYNFQSIYYSTKNGLTCSLDVSSVPVGKHNVEVVALPKKDTSSSSGVAEISFGSNKSNIVLNSDKTDIEFYVLGEIGEIIHILQGNDSIFTFPAVENANFYKLYINDTLMEAVNIYEDNGIVTCEMSGLSAITPKNGGYDIKVVAGRINNSTRKEIATRSTRLKRIEILDTAKQVPNQQNGSFAWTDIADDCLYSYEVYKTSSNYAVSSGQTPVLQENNVDVLKISQLLEEGYYKIRVKSVSIDKNLYLDSDFYDKNNILEVNFYVTKDIETPSATFFEESGKYKLNITTVENASLYEIYVNGSLDGQLTSQGKANEEYLFSDDFSEEKLHLVTIKALAGNRYDGTIYLTSQEFSLNVTRLATPEYLMNIEYTDFDNDNHQYFTIEELENSVKTYFYLNGVEVQSDEDYILDVVDFNTYGSEFKLGIILQARASQGNSYYLNSNLKEIEFVRADYPSALKFTDGKVTWTQNQANAEKNMVSLIISSGASSDYYNRFDLAVNPQEFDLQSYINALRKIDIAFDTGYRQLEKLSIKMLSYMNSESDKFYLPSFYGTTASTGTNVLEVRKLDAPVVTFDTEREIISWDYSIANTRFDIYIDDNLAVEDYTLSKSISISELSEYDFTTQKKIEIRAKNSNYLESDLSQAIYIKKLTTPTSLSIAQDGANTRASILITNDSAFVESVNVNGSADKVVYTTGSNIASFLPAEFATQTFAINLVAKNQDNVNYYISSDPITYTLCNLAEQEFDVVLNEETISWTEIGKDSLGHDIYPIVYVMTIENGGKVYTKTFEDKNLIKLTELETLAGVELVGEVKVSVKAVVSEDYILSSQSGSPKGYYGETALKTVVTHKLAQVNEIQVNVVDGTSYTNFIDNKKSGCVEIVFPDNWSAFENVIFNVNVANSTMPISVQLPQSGVTHLNYSFTKENNNYKFTLTNEYLKMLSEGEYSITFDVYCGKEIPSEKTSTSISKFAKTSSASINDDGVLTINDNQQNASYLIEIAVENKIIETSLLASNSSKVIDLMTEDYLLKTKGAYTIRILTFDENNQILPASEEIILQGYKLQGIENVEINDQGNIILTIFTDDLTNAVFTAECQLKRRTFNPKKVEDSENQYYISMLDLLNTFAGDFELIEGLYEFKFFIKEAGSMNSAPAEIKFNYAIDETPILTRGIDLDKDYIIFKKGTKSDTVSFRTILEATFYIENVDEETGVVSYTPERRKLTISYPSLLVNGYWVTDSNGENGYFVTEKDTSASHIYTAGYWKEDSNGNDGQFVTSQADDGYVYTAGYWVTDANGENGYFSVNKLDIVYTECYAINVNQMLAELDYGYADISLSRIGKKDNVYYQYNSNSFKVYKLNRINDVAGEAGAIYVKDNFLNFTWTQKDDSALDKKPTAYYVYFSDNEGKIITRTTVYTFSLDLRNTNLGLEAGKSYNISVVAVSVDKNTIASDMSGTTYTLRYTQPLALQVKAGMLVFDETQFENSAFMQDIKNYFNQTDAEMAYHNQVGNKQYLSPYYFSANQLKDMLVTLQFAKVNATGGITNEVYNITMPGYWLFPDIEIDFKLPDYKVGGQQRRSYYSLLSQYATLNGFEENTTTEALNVKAMIETLKSSPRGIGDNAILFDDLGRSVPAGAYSVSVIQTKSNQFVESVNGQAVPMYLSVSPDISLGTTKIDNLTQYVVNVTPAGTMVDNGSGYVEAGATTYKLSLRQSLEGVDLAENIELIIKYEDNDWSIYYQGNKVENGVSKNNRFNHNIPGFTINMSALRKSVNKIYQKLTNNENAEIIKANTLLRADIFVYNQDNLYVLNGKSAPFNVRYLDLQANSISFDNGKFVVSGEDNNLDNYDLLVKYKRSIQGEQSFTTKITNNKAEIQFKEAGEYSYIVLSLNGSISSNTMNIESASYGIYNLYKLHAPQLSTSNSNLIVSYADEDLAYMETLKFNMANNVSLSEGYDGVDKGYYFKSNITSTTDLSTYVVGSKNSEGKTLYQSELLANQFYAFINGSTGSFTLTEGGHDHADFLLTFSETYAVMTSDEYSIKARMLSPVEKYSLIEGHLILDDKNIGVDLVTNSDGDSLSGNLVYEIVIEYYIEDISDSNIKVKAGEEVFYSERQNADDAIAMAQSFSGLLFNSQYTHFRVGVTVLGGLRVDENTPNAKKTIEGSYMLLKAPVYFADKAQVLRSQEEKVTKTQTGSDFYLERTTLPYLADGSIGVRNGKIEFVLDNKDNLIYNKGQETESAKKILVHAEYVENGTTIWQLLTGTYEFTEVDGQVYVSFTPDEGQLNEIIGSFKIRIYVYGNERVISNPLLVSEVYKLPKMESKYYDIILDGSKTIINFDKYFNSVSINTDAKCYKIVVNYKLADIETIQTQSYIYTNAIREFTLPENVVYIDIQVQDGQGSSEAKPKKLIYSDTTLFDIQKTDITGLSVDWNPTDMRFEWNWEGENTEEYEYHVSIIVSGKKTTEVVTTNYYMPKDRGTIASYGFEIRARKISQTNKEILYTFSNALPYTGNEVAYTIFSGGNGTQNAPYLIRTEADFINMSKRNTNNFYFKLDANNISIDVVKLYQIGMTDFYGHLDGNSYTLKVVSTQVFDLDEAFTASLTGAKKTEFTQYSSLFKNLTASASIKNLFLDYEISYTGLNNSAVIFAPLCAYNFGVIDNVKVANVTITSLNGTGASNTAFVGGIVGINYGIIKNSTNSALLDYTMAQQLKLTFGYSGIAIFNASKTNYTGVIENCFNTGNKKITVAVSNNLVYLAGISLLNNGKISKAGNDGTLTLASTSSVSSMTGYYAGIAVSSINGTLEYVYNNATISNISSIGIFNYSGIAYEISGGYIKYLVVTIPNQAIVKSCTLKPNDSGTNYASTNSGTHGSISTSALSVQTIDCLNGYALSIVETADGFKAFITKS